MDPLMMFFLGVGANVLFNKIYDKIQPIDRDDDYEEPIPEQPKEPEIVFIDDYKKLDILENAREAWIKCSVCNANTRHVEVKEGLFQCEGCSRKADLRRLILKANKV